MDKILQYFKEAIQKRIDELTKEREKAAKEMSFAQLALRKAKEEKDDTEATLRQLNTHFDTCFLNVQKAQAKMLNIDGSITELLNMKNVSSIEVEN